jgi:hypothetical protein
MKHWLRIFMMAMLVATAFGTESARADGEVGILFYPTLALRRATGAVGGDQTVYQFDLRVGYRMATGWYFGMIRTQTTSSGSNAISQEAVGNSVGYFYGPFSVIGSYFLRAKLEEKGTVVRNDGDGTQLDFSYQFAVPALVGLSVGPTLSYTSFTYLRAERAHNVVTGDKHNESYLYPTIALSYLW